MPDSTLFTMLHPELPPILRDNNPWWRGEPIYDIPSMHRWAFRPILNALIQGMTPAVVLLGPRQVGKTTLLNQTIEALLGQGVAPRRIFRVQFDELPVLRNIQQPIDQLIRWYAENILEKTLNQAAHDGEQTFIFLDEVQNLPDWAPQLKHLVDIHPVRVLVTGSSALRIEAGRDSLAGRVTSYAMGPLLLREIAELRGLGAVTPYAPSNGVGALKEREFWQGLRDFGEKNRSLRDEAFAAYSERGAYPVVHKNKEQPWEAVADFLSETVIKRAIQHDLRMGPRGQKRDEHLLEEVFRLACRYAGQTPSLSAYAEELKQVMGANIGVQRILSYLKFLDGTLLLRLVEPLELRLKRRKGASKPCLCDHALRAAWLKETIPLAPEPLQQAPHLTDLAGRLAESAAGYFLSSIIHLDVAYFPERKREPEVDYILTIGEHRIPVEIKYRRRVEYQDTFGLRRFMEKPHYNAPFGLLITQGDTPAGDDPQIISLPLSTLLFLR